MSRLYVIELVSANNLIPVPHGEVLKVTQQVTHTQASARCFAGVCRSNALLGCSNAFIMKHKQSEVM